MQRKLPENAPGKNGFNYKPQWAVVLICNDEKHQIEIFNEMKSRGFKLKVLTV